MKIRLKHASEPPEKGDGARLWIERLWPRGPTKEKAGIDEWMKLGLIHAKAEIPPGCNMSTIVHRVALRLANC